METATESVAAPVESAPVLEALQEALRHAPVTRGGAALAWTVTDAVAALDTESIDIQLFAALRLLQAAHSGRLRLGYSHVADEDPVRIDQELQLGFAPHEVTRVEAPRGDKTTHRPTVTQTAVGLLGPNGALPYPWTEHAYDLAYSSFRAQRDTSFSAFINVLQRRQIGFLFRAWQDSEAVTGADRPHEPHPVGDRLRALAGMALADSAARDSVNADFKSAFASTLSRRVRSPDALAAMLAHHFTAPVRVEEFVARWLEIPHQQRTSLGVQFTTLGEDAVAGARVWDCATTFRIFIGPLTLERYRSFLPGGKAYEQLSDLVSLYAGVEFQWELVPVLANLEVPYSCVGYHGLWLGWSSWLGFHNDTSDAADLQLHMSPNLAPRGGLGQGATL